MKYVRLLVDHENSNWMECPNKSKKQIPTVWELHLCVPLLEVIFCTVDIFLGLHKGWVLILRLRVEKSAPLVLLVQPIDAPAIFSLVTDQGGQSDQGQGHFTDKVD